MGQLFTHLAGEGDLAGIVNCWPLDICSFEAESRCVDADVVDENHRLGVFAILRLVKGLAEHDTIKPRLFLVTANAQPAPGIELRAVDQAAIGGSVELSATRSSRTLVGLIDI